MTAADLRHRCMGLSGSPSQEIRRKENRKERERKGEEGAGREKDKTEGKEREEGEE